MSEEKKKSLLKDTSLEEIGFMINGHIHRALYHKPKSWQHICDEALADIEEKFIFDIESTARSRKMLLRMVMQSIEMKFNVPSCHERSFDIILSWRGQTIISPGLKKVPHQTRGEAG